MATKTQRESDDRPEARACVFIARFSFTLCVALLFILWTQPVVYPQSAEKVIGPVIDDPVASGFRLKAALENLVAGQTLTIDDGEYALPGDVKIGGLRADGQYKRIDGWNDKVTTIKARHRRRVVLRGNLQVKGSFIRIEGLVIKGAGGGNERPGIEVMDSHNIEIVDNEVAYCGGGGINFNQSDMILITQNLVHDNATRNPDQHSGISVYQPVNYGHNPREGYWGVLITRNICHSNRNEKTTSEGDLTDGNGIAVDDYKYTQSQYLKGYSLENIRVDDSPLLARRNRRVPYDRPTLIEGNLCYYNGGSGIQCFEAVGVKIKNNTCVGNRQRCRFNGQYSNLGQISLQNAKDCEVCNNVLQSIVVRMSPTGTCYAASEIEETENSGGNKWYNNLLHSTRTTERTQLRNRPAIDEGAIYEPPDFVMPRSPNYDFRSVAGIDRGITWGGGHVYVDLLGTKVSGDMKTDLGAIQTVDKDVSLSK